MSDTSEHKAKHDNSVSRWMGFAGIVLLIIAFWNPVRLFLYNHVQARILPAVEATADDFIVLAYNGVAEKPALTSENIAVEDFAAHMAALRENGYNPISLKDLKAYYAKGAKLPPKAVMITFVETLRSTYQLAEKPLADNHWTAVMGVNTRRLRELNPSVLLWPYLRDMQRKNTWELAAESENGYLPINNGPHASSHGLFFTDPEWIAVSNRYETMEEFTARIRSDHESVAQEFVRELGEPPDAFFFPYGNYGQLESDGQFIRDTNLELAGEYYQLSFDLGSFGYNMRHGDRRRIHRHYVDPHTSARELISLLGKVWPEKQYAEAAKGTTKIVKERIQYNPAQWLPAWGDCFIRRDRLTLCARIPGSPFPTGEGGTTGADAWLAGSDYMMNGHFSLRFRILEGQFRLFLRYAGPGDYLSVSLDPQGNVTVSQRHPLLGEQTVATDRVEVPHGSIQHLLVSLHEDRLFVHLNSKLLFGKCIHLKKSPSLKTGMIGISIWDPVPGVAQLELHDVRIDPNHSGIVAWQKDQDGPAALEWITKNAHIFTIIAPPWMDLTESGETILWELDVPRLSLLTKANGLGLYPQINIHSKASIYLFDPVNTARKVTELGFDGLLVNASAFETKDASLFPQWLEELNMAMRNNGKRLAVVFPAYSAPGLTLGNPGSFPDVIFVEPVERPDALAHYAGREYEMLAWIPNIDETSPATFRKVTSMMHKAASVSPEARRAALCDKGWAYFNVGNYRGAIDSWRDWAAQTPNDPEPNRLIGNAYLRLTDFDQASEAYRESLRIDPGQLDLAMALVGLYEQEGKEKEATELLDIYDRTFPRTPTITIAKAGWLDRHKQHDVAQQIMRELVELYPDNTQARIALHSYLDEPKERYDNVREILNDGIQSQSPSAGFALSISDAELLAVPESSTLFPFFREALGQLLPSNVRKLYSDFLPLTNRVHETLATTGISSNWVVWGGVEDSDEGRHELKSSVSHSEAVLRLRHSELMRDAFLRVSVSETVGSFWLYARRSANAMIRFGYDNDGYLRIQSWRNGRLMTSDSVPWIRPPGTIELSLEVRGDGATGRVNGKSLFTAPLPVPKEICYGWWGLAPYTQEPGAARADIVDIDAGPLPSAIVMLPQLGVQASLRAQNQIRDHVKDISALAPLAFIQAPDGSLPITPSTDLEPYRMFSSFHRLRLMPVVELAYLPDIEQSLLVDLIKRYDFDGLIVRMVSMPPREWIDKLATEVETTEANVILIQGTEPMWPPYDLKDPAEEFVRLRGLFDARVIELSRGNLLFPPVRDEWRLERQPWQTWISKDQEKRNLSSSPHLVIYPETGLVPAEGLEKATRLGEKARLESIARFDLLQKAGAHDTGFGEIGKDASDKPPAPHPFETDFPGPESEQGAPREKTAVAPAFDEAAATGAMGDERPAPTNVLPALQTTNVPASLAPAPRPSTNPPALSLSTNRPVDPTRTPPGPTPLPDATGRE